MRWQQGRTAVDRMIIRGELERVPASRVHAEFVLDQARAHARSAAAIVESDAAGAYQLLYDAARKALVAVLENQGLRTTSRGGHIALFEVVMAQLDPPMGGVLRPFDRMRRRRNESEYPRQDRPSVGSDDVVRDLVKTDEIIDCAVRILDQMSPY
jgi:hypothetical protein